MNMKLFLIGIFSFLTILLSCDDSLGFESVSVEEFEKVIQGPSVEIVDVRTSDEFAENHMINAINIDAAQVDFNKIAESTLSKDKTIAVYCRSGRRSKMAADKLTKAGFTVVELNKGFNSWTDAHKETIKDPN